MDGESGAPSLAGTLRPELQSRLRPAGVTITDNGPDITDEVMKPPTDRWPLEDNPGAMRALRFLGSTQKALGPEPRAAYWMQPFGPARWNQLAAEIAAVRFRRLPEADRGRFSEDEFEEAQDELVDEMHWVANVREYIANVANPFDQNIFKGWEAAQDIADEIYEEAHARDSNAALVWSQFTSIVLKLGGILTFGVTTEIGLIMDLGVWMAGTQPDGKPTEMQTKVKADEVGSQLADELRGAAQTFDQLGDVIVSDPKKLKLVGEEANCLPTSPDCNTNYSFTREAKRRLAADLSRSVERFAYERLLPLSFHVYNLAPETSRTEDHGGPRSAAEYKCGATATWGEFSPTALKYSTAALLQELDPREGKSTWQVLVMAEPFGANTYHGVPPSDRLLDRLFSAVPPGSDPAADDPETGGLGMSPEALLASYAWDDYRSTCHWP